MRGQESHLEHRAYETGGALASPQYTLLILPGAGYENRPKNILKV